VDDDDIGIGDYENSYATYLTFDCRLAGEPHPHPFTLPEGDIQPEWDEDGTHVFGCGLVLDPEDKVSIFFTLDGQLLSEFVLELLRIFDSNHNGLINLNLQLRKYQSVPRWIASFRQSQ
jgi:hypothetical protein